MITNDEMKNEMLESPIGGLLFRKALPTIIIQFITVVYNTADTYFVARINTEASAAVGIVFSIMAVIQAIGFGIGMGCGSIISRRLGASKTDEADMYGSSGLAASFLCGMLISTAGLIDINGLMHISGSTNSVLPYAIKYGKYILIAAPFMCMSFVLNNILRSEGQTSLAMIGMTSGGILNLILDPVFIFTLHMGISGAAIATMLSQIMSTLIMSIIFMTGNSIVKISPFKISRKIETYGLILKTGFPTICRQGLASLSSAILNIGAAVYGDGAIAAVSIANKLYMLIRNVILGIGQGYQPIAGYCYGAGKKERVRKLFWLSSISGTVICVLFAILMFIFRVPVITWFRDDNEVIKVGSNMIMYMCMSMPFLAYSTYVNQTYQCLGFSKGATFLACQRQGMCFVPLALILPRLIGVSGIEMLQPAADILTFVISVPFQIWFFRTQLDNKEQAKGDLI